MSDICVSGLKSQTLIYSQSGYHHTSLPLLAAISVTNLSPQLREEVGKVACGQSPSC
jgi:hypothetical protein